MHHHRTAPAAPSLHMGRSWWLILLLGALAVVLGVVAIVNPIATGAGLTWGIGVLALVEGVLTLLAVMRKDTALSVGWMLAYAVFSLLFGVLAVINPISMAASLIMVAGVWMLVAGVLRLVMAVKLRKTLRNEWTLVLSAVLAMILGALMVSTPVAGLIMAVVWMGVAALVYGLLQIFAGLRMRRWQA